MFSRKFSCERCLEKYFYERSKENIVKDSGITEYLPTDRNITVLLGKCDFLTLLSSQFVYDLTLDFIATNC